MTTRGPDPLAVAIARAVAGAIATAGMTYAETAERADIALNTFSRRMNGAIPFTWPELVRVARATGVRVTDLAESAERLADRRADTG
jgi:transcriptional regulator with XRE-family HTH domain